MVHQDGEESDVDELSAQLHNISTISQVYRIYIFPSSSRFISLSAAPLENSVEIRRDLQ